MAVNNVSGNIPSVSTNPAPKPHFDAPPRPRAGVENLYANDAWFAADGDLPTVGDPVGNGGGGGPRVGADGHAPGGRVVGGSSGGDIDGDEDGRGGLGRIFHRMFSGSGSGS